jgi:hypothetical protein
MRSHQEDTSVRCLIGQPCGGLSRPGGSGRGHSRMRGHPRPGRHADDRGHLISCLTRAERSAVAGATGHNAESVTETLLDQLGWHVL